MIWKVKKIDVMVIVFLLYNVLYEIVEKIIGSIDEVEVLLGFEIWFLKENNCLSYENCFVYE